MTAHPSGTHRQSLASRSGSIVLIMLSVLLVISTAGTHTADESTFPAPLQVLANVGAFVMMGGSVMLFWRKRWPVHISLGLIVATAVFPTTPLPVLIALPAAVAVTTGVKRWGLIVGTTAATAITFVWDVLQTQSYLSSFAGDAAVGSDERLALFWAVPLVAAGVVFPFAATGMASRYRTERDRAQLEATDAQHAAAAAQLEANVAQRETDMAQRHVSIAQHQASVAQYQASVAQRETSIAERSIEALHRESAIEQHRLALARELHDTLAANLSTLSLHAGALELMVGDEGSGGAENSAATVAARTVRESAQHSLDDLRTVVRELRHPQLPAQQQTGFADLPDLIDRAEQGGTAVHTKLFLTDAASCDPQTAHAVYRIVQEAISNVKRHAPHCALYLDVRGAPTNGITLKATNWLAAAGSAPTSVGGGYGLVGMKERVELLGGVLESGPTPEGAFGVAAWLPWRSAATAQ